jgi:exosome complex component RRP40
MSVVLPGELIQSQHKNLKLGPGLQQSVDQQGRTTFVVTRAGTLEQNPKGNKFWVEGNSRRVRASPAHLSVTRLTPK